LSDYRYYELKASSRRGGGLAKMIDEKYVGRDGVMNANAEGINSNKKKGILRT
jgi:hypothetical protein